MGVLARVRDGFVNEDGTNILWIEMTWWGKSG